MECKLEPVATLSGHQERVWCASWNPQGTLLASCGGDKIIRIWGKEGESAWEECGIWESHSKEIVLL